MQCTCGSLQWKTGLPGGGGVGRSNLSSGLEKIESAVLSFSFGDDTLTAPGGIVRGAPSLLCKIKP